MIALGATATRRWIAFGAFLFGIALCSPLSALTPRKNAVTTAASALVNAGHALPKGMDAFQAAEFMTKNGMNFYQQSLDWGDIETAPNQYSLQDTLINPLSMVASKYPFKGTLLIVKMIDSNVRARMPSDLGDKAFDDPEVRRRFLAMLRAISKLPSSKVITHVLLGNEVDQYLHLHPAELPAFMTLLKESIGQIHRDMPGVKVGTIVTPGLLDNPEWYKTITEPCDFVDYTYYPTTPKGWQMRSMGEVAADLNRMAKAAGDKPFSFTEIGYSASPLSGSSEQQQADFVTTVFDTLDQYRLKGRLAFISWANFADYAPESCAKYAADQGFPGGEDAAFCGFFNTLGLRTADNQPRKAWDVFMAAIKKWEG